MAGERISYPSERKIYTLQVQVQIIDCTSKLVGQCAEDVRMRLTLGLSHGDQRNRTRVIAS